MAGRNFLFVPGPTNVPDRILRAMAVPMEDHRSIKFPELTLRCLADLKKIFKTASGAPILFPSSGTGCWEAALTNCLNPGDRVLAARFGQFTHLWIEMCRRLGFEVEVLEVEWGEGAPVDRYRAALEADRKHSIKALLLCQNETATGTVEGDTWTWRSDSMMGGKPVKSRFTVKELSPTAYTTKFEMAGAGGAWNTIMEGKTTKIK